MTVAYMAYSSAQTGHISAIYAKCGNCHILGGLGMKDPNYVMRMMDTSDCLLEDDTFK